MRRINRLFQWIEKQGVYKAEQILSEHGTSLAYVKQIAYGNKNPSAQKAIAIEKATGVSRKLLIRHWRDVWPELTKSAKQ